MTLLPFSRVTKPVNVFLNRVFSKPTDLSAILWGEYLLPYNQQCLLMERNEKKYTPHILFRLLNNRPKLDEKLPNHIWFPLMKTSLRSYDGWATDGQLTWFREYSNQGKKSQNCSDTKSLHWKNWILARVNHWILSIFLNLVCQHILNWTQKEIWHFFPIFHRLSNIS
jgi:hypothetical protein